MQPIRSVGDYKIDSSVRGQTIKESRMTERETRDSTIKWEQNTDKIISADLDFNRLRGFQNVLLDMVNEFNLGNSKAAFTGLKQSEFEKRLLLLESQIQGLLRRKIDYVPRGQGDRVLDYTGILNEKENQIIELEKKINNLEQRLRKATARQIELENEVARLFQEIKVKDKIISSKNQVILGEVASSNLLKETLLKSGIQLPNIGSLDIKAESLTNEGAMSRSSAFQQLPENKKNKVQLIQLFRQFEKVNSGEGISTEEIDRALEAFTLGLQGSKWRESVETRIKRRTAEDNYNRLKEQFSAAISIIESTLNRIREEVPSFRLSLDPRIFQMLRDHKINTYKVAGDVLNIETVSERTVEVPVQDARTKHLLHLLATELKRITQKYPKLQSQMDGKLMEFFQQQLIDIIEVDEVDKLVEIVKYVPQVVKVENVYAYSSQKSRKIEFHLRVLIKALLEELEKIRARTGVVLEMDEGVVGMIRQEIMGVVDVDDILKVFRVVPKIVEVEKIVQKIVERIVEVPQVVTVDKITQKIVEVEKIKQVERVVNVPLEMPVIVTNIVQKIVPVQKIIERVVEVPQIIERIIQVIKEVPKIVTVEKIVEKIVEVEKVVEVERIVNHVQVQIREVPVVKEVIVNSEPKIVEKIVEVPVIIQKLVEKVVQVPQIIEVEKIVEKIVPLIEYRNAKQIQNHVEIRHQIVDRIVEKPIPIIQTVQKIVQVPQIVEKIVQTNTIIREPYEVQVLREKILVQDRIKEVEVIRDRIVIQNREVVKEVEKIVQIPVFQERIVKIQEIVQKPIIQRSQTTIIKEVYLRDPQIITEPKIVQVEKIINHIIEVPKPVKYIEQKIVQVIRHVDRIKEVKVPVQKIIQKMVQVPKVVEVEKIVEKIIVVPRVVEKIVQVPQIIERIVPKIIVEERIKQVERIVQVPVVQERPVEIETVKNVYVQVQKAVDRIVDKLVQVPRYEEKIINNEVIVEKIIEVIKEVPKQIQVEKLIYNTIEVAKPVEIQNQIIVPIQVPIPVEKVIEKIVPVTEIVEKIVQVPQVVQKIVAQRVEEVRVDEIVRVEEKIVVDQIVKQVFKEVPYISEKIKEITVEREKIVPIQSIVQEIVTAQLISEKVVERVITVPKVQQVERTSQIVVEVPKIVQVERIIPQLVNVNRYIEKIVQKIVEVPIIVEQIKEIVKESEKIIEVKNEYETVREVEKIVEKAVIMQKFKEVVRNINHIEKVLQIIDRYEQTPVPIISYEQKFVEVPYILEKIVEKIVVMPQIVEVLKYVHQVVEEQTLGVAVGVETATHEQRYKMLTQNLKSNIGILLSEMRKARNTNPTLGQQIQVIEKFIAQLQQFILFPRIVQIPKEVIVEKIVEKEKLVQLPTQDQRSIKMELTLSLLVEKLIVELKKIKQANPSLNFELEDDIKLIFFSQLDSYPRAVGDDFNKKLRDFSDAIYRKFDSLGQWSYEHQLMLNSFLQQRFMMANLVKSANSEIEKVRSLQLEQEEKLRNLQGEFKGIREMVSKLRGVKGGQSLQINTLVEGILGRFSQIQSGKSFVSTMIEKSSILPDLQIADDRLRSLIRQKDAQIQLLRQQITKIQTTRTISSTEGQGEMIRVLQLENMKLKNQINDLRVTKGSEELIRSYQVQIKEYEERILELQREKSELNARLSNLQREFEVKSQLSKQFAQVSMKTESKVKMQEFSSPVATYKMMGSPADEKMLKMVESQIQKNVSQTPGGGSLIKDTVLTSADKSKISASGFSAYRSPSESESVASSSREGFASSARYGAGLLTESSRLIATGQQPPQSSTIYQSGYNLSTTQQPGLNPQYQPTTSYVAGSSGLRTSGYEATSSLYQPSSSSTYQVGTYPGQSGLYQPGTYQPGQYQTSQYTSQASYQLSGQSNYQPYQSTSGLYSSSSSIYRSGYQPPKPSEGGSK